VSLRRTITAAAILLASISADTASPATLPPGFQETIVFSGLTQPTAVRFSPDGRVFVAEKSGLIKVFDSLSATTPTIFADLRTNVCDYWDRGLLGLALHPNFPATPYVYVLYSYDGPIGGAAPTWLDTCPTPPGETDGCVISGRLSRLTASGNAMAGTEVVLLEAWGQQFSSHSIGDIAFGSDGALYVSGGDGASFNNVDYGQFGSPRNPLGDPPVPVGGAQTPPTAEGGALRSQSLLRTEGGPALSNGAILRVDDGGNPLPDNPLSGSSDAIAQRIIASGLRNPFRFTIQPGTGSVWIGDVGWATWEEIDKIPNPTAGLVNFGWPCYEGTSYQPSYAAANLDICTNLYAASGAVTSPFYAYKQGAKVVSGESCPTGSSSISGLAFYTGDNYPSSYRGALFFADYSRRCLWVMLPDAGGQPDPSNIATFIAGAANPVDLQTGPGGDLFYVDLSGGKIRRIRYLAPTAMATATPQSGLAPLTVQFDGSESQPARPGDSLTYAWDLDGDGEFLDSTQVNPTWIYASAGTYTARLRVTESPGVLATSNPIVIAISDSPPTATIDSPAPVLTWKVGDTINFSGHAKDLQEGALPASSLSWTLFLHHCPSDCHVHTIQTFPGVSSGSFTAPDHEFPSYLELQLTATDSAPLTSTAGVLLYPKTVLLNFRSNPTGLQIASGTASSPTPFSKPVIVGSQNSIVAPSAQALGGIPYELSSRSDGGAASHTVVADSVSATYTATYRAADPSLQFFTVTPCRVVDTRNPPGPLGGPGLAANGDRSFSLAGHCGIPTAARAVAINVTVTQPTAMGDVCVYAGGAPLPGTSVVNYAAGQTRASSIVAPLGASGDVAVHCGQTTGSVQLIVDVSGYFQ
jgi:glucose/arabinose dehydrogenase